MFRFCIVVGLCAAFALAGCVPPPHHHRGPAYESSRRDYPPPHAVPGHPHGSYWGPRWH